MARVLKIGVVGCGAIGSQLAKAIVEKFQGEADLVAIFDVDLERAYKLSATIKKKKIVVLSLEDLIKKSNLVVEAASGASCFEIAKSSILAKRDIMVMSVGGILGHPDIFDLARENGRHIYIPSGALAGLDAIKAASLAGVNKITLTTRKPPHAFIGVPYVLKSGISLDKITDEEILFEGDVDTAVRLFPQNINVAAILKLATARDVSVRIIASAKVINNIHEIELEGDFGKLFTRTENLPSKDNPKTSFLAGLSALATLRQILAPVKIGT